MATNWIAMELLVVWNTRLVPVDWITMKLVVGRDMRLMATFWITVTLAVVGWNTRLISEDVRICVDICQEINQYTLENMWSVDNKFVYPR